MKRVLLVSMLVALTAGAAAVQARQGGNCWFEGAWIGEVEGGGSWLAINNHKTPNSGTISLQFYDIPASLIDPAAEQFGETVGVFERTGPRTFDYTMWTHAIDGIGNIVYTVKNSGVTTLTADCQEYDVVATVEYFTAFGDFCVPGAGTATRITVDEGCTP
jgi:hypothetical protein